MQPASIRPTRLFGLVLHDEPEGFAMANVYLASPALGLPVAMVGRYRRPGFFRAGVLVAAAVYAGPANLSARVGPS